MVTDELADGGSDAVYDAASHTLPDSAAAALDEAPEARVWEVASRDQRSLCLQHVEYLMPGMP